ncbi:hypothetical protein HDU76_007192 [Blyttiomyces sp. JEL0837]|nr:hypothetical protein HDU76_007192 [Blyttiomyces sp. JEL0837]
MPICLNNSNTNTTSTKPTSNSSVDDLLLFVEQSILEQNSITNNNNTTTNNSTISKNASRNHYEPTQTQAHQFFGGGSISNQSDGSSAVGLDVLSALYPSPLFETADDFDAALNSCDFSLPETPLLATPLTTSTSSFLDGSSSTPLIDTNTSNNNNALMMAGLPIFPSPATTLAASPFIGGNNGSVTSSPFFTPDLDAYFSGASTFVDDSAVASLDEFNSDFALFEDLLDGSSGSLASSSAGVVPQQEQQQMQEPTVVIPLADLGAILQVIQSAAFMAAASSTNVAAPIATPVTPMVTSTPDFSPALLSEHNINFDLDDEFDFDGFGFDTASSAPSAAIETPPTVSTTSGGPIRREATATKARRRPSKLYHCPHPGCTRAFTRAFNLKTHESIHDPSRDRPFNCESCDKTFVRVHDLIRHRAVHSAVKEHVCVGCGKGFTRKDALRRHAQASATCRLRFEAEEMGM